MAGAHIGHDCLIADDVTIAGGAQLAGHVEVQAFAIIGGQAGLHQFVRVGERAMVGGCAAVSADVIPFGLAFGNHARLTGLNVVGLKRAGLGRDRIHALRRAVRSLFEDDSRPFRDNLAALEAEPAPTPEVARMLDFIRTGADRPLMGKR
jgi:UDP-N-acetylglucosamine acyltransferase